jgi:hypothetical protein
LALRREDLKAIEGPTRAKAERSAAPRQVQRSGLQGDLLCLQRMVGNRAVNELIQRDLSVKAADLDASRGKSNTRGVFGKGASSFATLQKALKAYEKEKGQSGPEAEGNVEAALELIEQLSIKWLNEHRDATTDQDAARRHVVDKLADDVGRERLALGRKHAQNRYLESLTAGLPSAGGLTHAPKDFEHKLTTASGGARNIGASAMTNYESDIKTNWVLNSTDPEDVAKKKARDLYEPRAKFFAKYGISAAESAGLRIYTNKANEYRYMTAASGNDPGWIDKIKANPNNAELKNFDTGALMEEGSLHVAMATEALLKIPPYRGMVLRGDTFSQARFDKLGIGPHTFASILSATTDKEVALSYLATEVGGTSPIGAIWVLVDSGGRSVDDISEVQGESEILHPPGTNVWITDIIPADAPDAKTRAGACAYLAMKLAKEKALNPANQYYVILTKKMPKPPALPKLPKPAVPPLPPTSALLG